MKTEELIANVENQRFMNRRVLENLKPLGVTENDERKLDFFFYAPDKKIAKMLTDFIRRNTDYRMNMPYFNGKNWSVTGSTSPISLSTSILDIWVEKMCQTALRFKCHFDGWGTLVLR